MQLAWATDPHLEWLSERELNTFLETLAAAPADAILITGDISVYTKLGEHLQKLNKIGVPIYFVLGNHDFYGTRFAHLRKRLAPLVRESKNLLWLTQEVPIELTPRTVLIGHDGWACGTAGLRAHSDVELADYAAISDFLGVSRGVRFDILRREAKASVSRLQRQIRQLTQIGTHIILATHAPPFEKACLYEGRQSGADFVPHFCNKLLGEMLIKELTGKTANNRRLSVFCGHTHHEAYVTITDNIAVKVGHAAYGFPFINQIIDVDVGC